ncbi:hypothetical protein C8R43DRAFT_899533 [Mycena crocata]|nr:hypothetical protein C8R43DRAFT_899533 [Mycena crocata]
MDSLSPSFKRDVWGSRSSELGTHSMVLGGSAMYLKPGEQWPICSTCEHPLVPLVQINTSSNSTPEAFRLCFPSAAATGGPLATMLQLFVCPVDDCYIDSTRYSTETPSWLVRIASVPLSAEPSASSQVVEARARIEQGQGFLPARILETWKAGREERMTIGEEELNEEDRDELDEHGPKRGLKLLGHAVRGEFSTDFVFRFICINDFDPGPDTSCDEHPCKEEGDHDYRELIQLGDDGSYPKKSEALRRVGVFLCILPQCLHFGSRWRPPEIYGLSSASITLSL